MANPHATTTHKTPNYYTILNLSTRKYDPTLTPSEVKAAYKRALLQHHPDKKASTASTPSTPSQSKTNKNITIDSIALAYKILSSPSLKAEYDLALQTSRRSHNNSNSNHNSNADFSGSEDEENDKVFRTGLETVDLDDLDFVEESSGSGSGGEQQETWTRGCRCGDDGGFVVTEKELEANAEDGEVIVGCRGCSLWLRVLFGVEG